MRKEDPANMAGKDLDNLAKEMAEGRISRGTALKRMGLALFGGGLLAAFGGSALAAPRTCATCTCGVGRPCNPKSTACAEVGKQFPTTASACTNACSQQGMFFCGGGTQFHCPQGCPA
jgi:hypothetical protein